MTVVSDTSPINYLTLIGLERLLPALLGRVIIPVAVQQEFKASGAPLQIREMSGRETGSKQQVHRRCPARFLPAWIRARWTVTGTLGVQDHGARTGLIDATDAVDRLRKTSFRASPKLYRLLLGPATKSATTRHKNEPKTGSRAREQEEGSD